MPVSLMILTISLKNTVARLTLIALALVLGAGLMGLIYVRLVVTVLTAKTKAITLVNLNRNDPYAKYYLGSIYSILAAYEASTARKFWSAMRNGSKGIDAHQQVLKLKPDYYDAFLSVGLYDYVIGNLPFPVKALIAMGGVRVISRTMAAATSAGRASVAGSASGIAWACMTVSISPGSMDRKRTPTSASSAAKIRVR